MQGRHGQTKCQRIDFRDSLFEKETPLKLFPWLYSREYQMLEWDNRIGG